MKYFKTLNMYKAANVTFDPSKVEARSYGWWIFVQVIDGLVVFNEYRYSVTTAKHQNKVRRVLNELGITVDLTVECPDGLQSLPSGVALCERRIEKLQAEIATKGTKKAKNIERAKSIKALQAQLKVIKALSKSQAIREAA